MLIDETSFGDMMAALGDTASAVFADWIALAFVVALALALVRWGIRGTIKAFDMMDSKYDDET